MIKFDFEDTVKLTVDRVAGTKNDTCKVYASSLPAAAKGLCGLIEDIAKYFGVTQEEIVCRIAVKMFGPVEQEVDDGKADV